MGPDNVTRFILLFTLIIGFMLQDLDRGISWPCHQGFEIKRDKNGQPVSLTTQEAIRQAVHCQPPTMPELARQARLEGTVTVQIAVTPDGKVKCVRVLHAHPLLKQSAVDAARQWTFRPLQGNNSKLGFLAQLVFYYSTGVRDTKYGKCVTARWPYEKELLPR